jgi:Dimerisation and cyclophilin-binding domain of Mon2
MEFLRIVEDELKALSAEARKRYPEVTEAAERAVLRLRGMREQSASINVSQSRSAATLLTGMQPR